MTKQTMIVRVDKEKWTLARQIFPKESDATISRMLYDTNLLIKLERNLKKFNKEIR